LHALRELGGQGNAAAVAKWLDKRPHHVSRELQELVNKGLATRVGREGKTVVYALAAEPAQ
jgi:predicted transcriptional regulator